MLWLEWWVYETLVFVTGLLPRSPAAQLGAAGFVMQVSVLAWALSYSASTAAATRVANALGAGHAANARRVFRLACGLLLAVNAAAAAALWMLRGQIAAALTTDLRVAAEIARILPVAAIGCVGDGQVAALGGLLRATGRQSA